MWGNFLRKVPPRPLKNSLTKGKKIKLLGYKQTVDARIRPRFCYRKKSSTAETLFSKRVVYLVGVNCVPPAIKVITKG